VSPVAVNSSNKSQQSTSSHLRNMLGRGCAQSEKELINTLDQNPKYRHYSGLPHTSFHVCFGAVPRILRSRGPFEAKFFVQGPQIDLPGAPGRIFDLKCAACGRGRRILSMPTLQGRDSVAAFRCHV
jgi:hypothetical protein